MSRIPQNFIDDLLARVDIVEVIDHRVKLKRSGKNYSACCPFHEEKTPSFTVSPDKQFYYCFGCGASGTAITFLMEYERSGFIDAVESLAKTAGVEVPRESSPQEDQKHAARKKLYDMLERAASYYVEQLKSHRHRQQAVNYLLNRGLDGKIAKHYGLGYAAPGWDNLLLQYGQNEHDQTLLIDTGLVIDKAEENKRYDRFRNRIMFPIRDVRGRVIGFGGRVLGDDKPKYLNSPETEVFSKGQELYGLFEAKQTNRQLEQLIVVEGYMDVIALAQFGLSCAVATLGTACGEEHLRLAFRHVNEVIFCFDGDRAGRNAAKRALLNSLSSMADGRQIRFLFLPDGQDPDSLIRQIGLDRFKAQLQHATPLEEYLFEVAAEGIDLNSMEGRARFAKTAAPMIHQLPEGIFRTLMMDTLAKRTGLSTEGLSEFTQVPESMVQVEAATEDAQDNHSAESEAVPEKVARRQLPVSRLKLTPARSALILLLDHPEILHSSEQHFEPSEQQRQDPDVQNLCDLIAYLKKRPQANFNNIIGFWAGAKGIEAQQALSNLLGEHAFGELKDISEDYQPAQHFLECLTLLQKQAKSLDSKQELANLTQKGLKNLNEEEKARYRTLISSI
jgi:DNA primase